MPTWESTWLGARGGGSATSTSLLGPGPRASSGTPVPDVAPPRAPPARTPPPPGSTCGRSDPRPSRRDRAARRRWPSSEVRRPLGRIAPGAASPDRRRLRPRALQRSRLQPLLADVLDDYSFAPDASLRERLRRGRSRSRPGRAPSAAMVATPRLRRRRPSGSHCPSARPARAACLVGPLAQTPEADVHGEFVEGLRARARPRPGRPACPRAATYRPPVGSKDLVREPRPPGAPPALEISGRERPRGEQSPVTTVTRSLVAHTNVGKTTLPAPCCVRDRRGARRPHVTTLAEATVLIEATAPASSSGTPRGSGTPRACMTRLRLEGTPSAGSCTRPGTACLTAPLWCSQEAVRNVRARTDVVLYLANATEDPEAGGLHAARARDPVRG